MFFKNCVILVTIISAIEADKPCLTPKGILGQCIPLDQCEYFKPLKTNPGLPRMRELARKSHCRFLTSEPEVCCPPKGRIPIPKTPSDVRFVSSEELPDDDSCGLHTTDNIIGGQAAGLDEYPWMVLLDYVRDGNHIFNCTGSLINQRYVLTAAHCISAELKHVYLGVYDNSKTVSCLRDDCTDPAVIIDVEEAIVFNSYNYSIDRGFYHDIALIRMKEKVEYSKFIKPICLPFTVGEITKNYLEQLVTASGWGTADSGLPSRIKLKVKFLVRRCRVMYTAGHICAGGHHSKDTCNGDSGGPLMSTQLNKKKYFHVFAIGVLSSGPEECGSGEPGVYTRISNYAYWIVDNLRP